MASERTVTARLRLLHNEYTKGAREAAKSTRGIGDEADKTSKRTSESWGKLGQKTADLGDSMTTRVTLPLVALGGAAVKMSADFDAAFTNMQTLAGVSADEVDALKESVLGLAADTGKAPQELAEALYFIRSAGLSGKDALDALEMSAKGAAAGLGSTVAVADAVTSAMNGYGAANLSAADATDVLIKTAQEGKAEASELAPQFGRIIPIAAELGVTFDEVGAAMAFLSRSSGDAALSATQVNGVLSKLLQPGVEGAEALAAIGTNAKGLRQEIREKGLLQTLVDLRSRLEANGLEMGDFSKDLQFLGGALPLTANGAKEASEVFDSLAHSTGATEEAFSKWAESMGAKNQRAWAEAQVAMIKFGDIAMPIVADFIGMLGSLADAFGDLPDGVKEAILIFGAMVAAMGPVLSVAGRLAKVWNALSKLDNLASTFAATSIEAAAFTVVIGATIYGLMGLMRQQQQSKKRIDDFADALAEGGNKAKVASEEMLTAGLTAGGLGRKLAHSGADLSIFTDDMREGAEKARELEDALQATAGRGANDWRVALDDAADSGNKFAEQIRDIVDAENLTREETINLLDNTADLSAEYMKGAEQAKANAIAQEQVEKSASEAGLAIDEQGNIVDATAEQIDQLTGALDSLLGKYLTVDETVRRQNELMVGLGAHFDEMHEKYGRHQFDLDLTTEAGIKNADMLDGLVEASGDTISAMVEQGASSEDLRTQWQKDRGELQLVIEKFRRAGQDVSKYDELIGEINTFVATQITTPGLTPAQLAVANFKAQLDQLPWVKTVHVNALVSGEGLSLLAGKRARGGPVLANRLYEVAEQGRAELLEMGGRTYLIPGSGGHIIPAGGMTTGGYAPGNGGSSVYVDMRGAIVSDERRFERMVSKAWNRAVRTTRGVNVA